MSNGAECCVLQICCPPEAAHAALASKLVEHGCSEIAAKACADYLTAEFTFAPKSFEAVIQDIVRLARKHESV